MRKQTKIAAIVSAAALLALGASITSFAAVRGTWRMEDGEWKCYDKNGDAYENVFAISNGKEYYVGEDGLLVRSDWVEYDGSYYFVNSAGQKITNDWRLTTPYDDPDEDEQWYYFQSSGKRAENKKISWKGKTYYFDTDGKMLTGWVTSDGSAAVNEANNFEADNTYYCDETGARVVSDWVETTEPGTEEDDADADTYYYYLKSNGKAATGKRNNIKGLTYFFDTEGRMLSGWVAYMSDSKAYKQIDKEDAEESIAEQNGADVYYCGDSDDGHAKKNKWVKLWAPEKKADEEEDDLRWFWFDKSGKVFTSDQATEVQTVQKYKFNDAELLKDTTGSPILAKKKINSKDYWFNDEGEMASGFYMIYSTRTENGQTVVTDQAMYYFGGADDGSMKTGSQSIKDDNGDVYKFYFSTKGTKGAGVTGNQSNKLYYYGRLVQATDYKYSLATIPMGTKSYTFIVNANGSIQHNNSQYKEDGDVLIDARNVAYEADSEKVKEENKLANGQYVGFLTDAGATKYAIDFTAWEDMDDDSTTKAKYTHDADMDDLLIQTDARVNPDELIDLN